MLPNTDLAGAQLIAEKIRARMQAQHWVGLPERVTVSLGVGTLMAAPDDGPALLRRVDAALYVAKNDGRNQVATADAWTPRQVPVAAATDRRA